MTRLALACALLLANVAAASVLICIRADKFDTIRPNAEDWTYRRLATARVGVEALGSGGLFEDETNGLWYCYMATGAQLTNITAEQLTDLTNSVPTAGGLRNAIRVGLDVRPADLGLSPVAGETP